MAVRQVPAKTTLEPEEFIGLTADTKPTVGPDGLLLSARATFLELDGAKRIFIFDGISAWYEL